jgi:hypothetical protein
VATLAISGGERGASAGMRWIRGVLPILQVAGIALGREAIKNSGRQLFVALVALDRRVGTQQGETVLVILYLLYGHIPTLNGMALRAIRSHLPTVNIRVTVSAVLAHVGEDRLGVTFHAFHFFVHAAQWVAGLVVIEFRDGSDGMPGCRGVAVLTGDRQRAMRIAGGFLLRVAGADVGGMGGNTRRTKGGEGQERPERELE